MPPPNFPATLWDLLAPHPAETIALAAPGRPPLSYGALRTLAEDTVAALNRRGIGRNDRLAIVLPNGPEMAAAFVALGCGATTAPLNPAYRAEEYEFYLGDLGAKTLVVEAGSESPARAVAEKLAIPVLELNWQDTDPAGLFQLSGEMTGLQSHAAGWAGPADQGLVLHTSGTTSRPKIVPLTQGNLCASAHHIATTLALTAVDRCMNIMPLFHIHGLVAAVLASLKAGGSVYCTLGFNALKVYGWLTDAEPSWYTAVPTMHQAILSRAARQREAIASLKLRFIRSSSSSLPPQVMAELEKTFKAPVLESYGMTEAAHQMTSNPLPPAPRKPGSVGVAAGPEVAILDEQGNILGPDQVGEIAIRGPNVTAGYENNPKANAESFTAGWFRTGDQGTLDAEGYLRITGRLKEIINRGGEKVSPREVDEVLMDHPAVAQVVTFALPHPKLGEEVAAAAVLREGMGVDEAELRAFAAARLADFKVPRKIVFLDEIPKGATGKLQRIGLAEKLGLTA